MPELDIEKLRRLLQRRCPDELVDEARLELTVAGKRLSVGGDLSGAGRRASGPRCRSPNSAATTTVSGTPIGWAGSRSKYIVHFPDLSPKYNVRPCEALVAVPLINTGQVTR